MNLEVLLPFRVFAQKADVLRIVVETRAGSFGLLPHRRDCLAALVPGILTYETKADGTVYLAVDEGVMIKAGADVLVSVRRVIGGTDLAQLHEAVKAEFLKLNDDERAVRNAVAGIEGGLMSRLATFEHGR